MKSEYHEKRSNYYEAIENALPKFLPRGDTLQKSVEQAMAYSLLGGGKRVRGILTLGFHEQCSGKAEAAMPFACAIEMLHAYSLIHDDLPSMDNDDLRRGKPSCHKQFGEAIAILAGDGLQALAFETALAPGQSIPPELLLRAGQELAAAVGTAGMIGGQVIDIEHEDMPVDVELLTQLNRLKTGALFRVSARIGCILAGAEESVILAADRYAEKLGLAFQITDDILDITSTAQVLGKPIASDAKRNKSTYATLLGLDEAKNAAQTLIDEAKAALKDTLLDCRFLADFADQLAERQM